MATVAELRQILKEDSNGKNLYDHLTETLMKVLLDRPANAYDEFEHISTFVKENPLDPDPTKGGPLSLSPEEVNAQLKWKDTGVSLLKKPAEAPDAGAAFPDLIADANMLEWAGVSIGKSDLYKLYLSIKRLSEAVPSAVKLRFFGKICTRGLPYYVVQGENDEPEGIDEKLQEGKAGANKYAYWVSSDIPSDVKSWIKLPNVTSEMIVASRQIKRMLTGNLAAPVPSYPPFPGSGNIPGSEKDFIPGSERDLLRAQLGRIAASTSIAPADYYVADEEGNVKLADEPPYAAKSSADVGVQEGWKHFEPELNKLGRVTKLPASGDEENPVEIEGDEAQVALRDLQEGQWVFRTTPGGAATTDKSIVVGRSILWPGAIAVVCGTSFINMYIGNGIAYEAGQYSPPLPRSLQKEWEPSAEADGLRLDFAPDALVDPTPPAPAGEEEA